MCFRLRVRAVRCALAAAGAVLAVGSLRGETLSLELYAWTEGVLQTNGWTISGLKKYASGALKDAAYFDSGGDYILTPTVAKPIRTVTVESATTSTGLMKELRLVPIFGGAPRDEAAHVLDKPTGTAFSSQTLDVSATNATCYRLISSTGTGNWAVRRVAIAYGEDGPLPRPAVTNVDEVVAFEWIPNGFALEWAPVPDAVGYVINVWTNGTSAVTPGTAISEPVVTDRVVAAPPFAIPDTLPTVYGYSVAARFEIGGTNVDSSAVCGEVDMADPPWRNCWRVSEFVPTPGWSAVDLSRYGKVTKQFDWTNGRASGGLHAFVNGVAATSCRSYSQAAIYGGIYCYDAGTDAASTNAIALLGTSGAEVALALPVRLDSARKLTSFVVSFDARRLNEGEAKTELVGEWAIYDDFREMTDAATEWHEAVRYEACETNGTYDVSLPLSAVRAARYACFRWRVPKQAKSAMIGLSDIRVTATQRSSGLAVIIR